MQISTFSKICREVLFYGAVRHLRKIVTHPENSRLRESGEIRARLCSVRAFREIPRNPVKITKTWAILYLKIWVLMSYL